MNVIITNKYQSVLQSLDIDVIKKLEGEFDVDEIISTFQNFYFQKMILDITALKGYTDIKVLQKLSISLDMNKVILLLDDSTVCNSTSFLSKLISMGIYNFTKNVEGIMYLYNNPNSYRDVAHIHQLDADMSSTDTNNQDGKKGHAPVIIQTIIQSGQRIIAFTNVTRDAGSSTLVYMLKKELEKNYNVLAAEVERRDFQYFRDSDLISIDDGEVASFLVKNKGYDVVLLDANDSASALAMATDAIYLIEPSTIKLNKLMMTNGKMLDTLKDKKVILNKSVLNSKDVLDFEYESKLNVFFNLPCLDDREDHRPVLNEMLVKLGFGKQAN